MITEKQIEIANVLLSKGVNCVYHSVELIADEKGVKFPAYKIGNEQYFVGPDDTKPLFAYIRQTSATVRIDEKLLGGCSKMYRISTPTRIVIFQDHVKEDFDLLTRKMLAVAFLKDVSLVSFNNNAFELAKQESPIGKFAFDATTFYLAIDVQIKLWLTVDNCNSNDCIVYPNPICK